MPAWQPPAFDTTKGWNIMGSERRYDALVKQHRQIEGKLSAEMARPRPNESTLKRLKREKLVLKDEIHSWERLMSVFPADLGVRQAGLATHP
ncbi:MAG: YdcH family protein [Geminicoccaceae bacterium]